MRLRGGSPVQSRGDGMSIRRLLVVIAAFAGLGGADIPVCPDSAASPGRQECLPHRYAKGGQATAKSLLQIEPGHPWRPPFGLDRVGRPLEAVVTLAERQPPASEFVLVGYRNGREISRQKLSLSEKSRVAGVALDAYPDEVVLLVRSAPGGESIEVARQPVAWPSFEAEAVARPDRVVNPVDLGTVLVPADWLLLAGGQEASLEVAALSRSGDLMARATAWYESSPQRKATAALSLIRGRKTQATLAPGPCSRTLDRDILHVAIQTGDGKELWHKQIRAMLVPHPPKWPEFGAVCTKLRYDAPILSVVDGKPTSLNYDRAWAPQLQDVAVFLPNGARWVFWRGANYIPFWAGRHNTGLCYEWAERLSPNAGFTDCPEPLMDKELRYGRVEIIESTAARVHVRWNYQSCDFNYRVNGDLCTEDYYFYPDGFGTRCVTLTATAEAEYELAEFILLTPQAAFPLDVLPPNAVDIIAPGGAKAALRFPFLMKEQQQEWDRAGNAPAVYRVRLDRYDGMAAISFCPRLTRKPQPYGPFYDRGVMVTPMYWGGHWPLSRGYNTGWSIDDRIALSPAHNSLMTWGPKRPEPIRSSVVETKDGLGRRKTMKVQTWVWLIGMTDADDARLIQWAKSFSGPPSVEVRGARLEAESYAPERRAIRLIVEDRSVMIATKPAAACVNPVFELDRAPAMPLRVRLADRLLDAKEYAWDGKTLWLNAMIDKATVLRLEFTD
jgi:hypothetical protein